MKLHISVVVSILMALVAVTSTFEEQPDSLDDLLQEEHFMEYGSKVNRYERLPNKPNDSSNRDMRIYQVSAADLGFGHEDDAIFEYLHRDKRQALEEEGSGSLADGVETRVKVAGTFSTAAAATVKTDLTSMITVAYAAAEVDADSFTVTVTDAGDDIMLATIITFFTSANQRILVAYATRKYIQGQQIGDYSQSAEPTVINSADQERTLTCFLCAPGFACASGSKKCAARSSSTSTTALFPWGYSTNDDKLRHEDLASSQTITLPFNIAFDTTEQSYLSIGDKGVLSFPASADASGYNSGSLSNIDAVSEKIVCAFCADIDQSLSGDSSEIFYHVYAVQDGTEETMVVLNRATAEVRAQFEDTFTAQEVVVATWWNVPYAVETSNPPTGRNTFQAVIITDGKYSFLMLFYEDMEWPQENQDVALAGFKHLDTSTLQLYKVPKSANDQRTSINFENIPGTGSGNQGFFFLRLGTIASPAAATINKQACGKWFQSNFLLRDNFISNADALGACSCAKKHMNTNSGFNRLRGTLNSRTCYEKITSTGDDGLICCYSGNALDNGWHSRYIRFRSGDRYTNNDLNPVNKCCLDASGMCHLVRIVRPLNDCNPQSTVNSAAGLGDPHITTFDGLIFSMNPVGDFQLSKIESTPESFTWDFQGRMGRMVTSDGSLSQATIYTGIAAKQTGSEPFHGGSFLVQINEDKTDFVVFVNGKDVSNQYRQNLPYPDFQNKIFVARPETKSIKFSFPGSDISITITRSDTGVLSYKTDLPKKHIAKPGVTIVGLMGNADTDKNNDLKKKNGETLPITATEKEILEMGKTWRVSEAESLFPYIIQDYNSINDETFTPLFISDLSAEALEEAKKLCGDNNECILDYGATGDETLASQTKTIQAEVKEAVATQANTAPNIMGKSIWNVKVGVAASTTYTATDPDGETVTFVASSKPDALTLNTNTGVASWTPTDTTPVSFVINALDARLMASKPIDVLIILCEDCKNGATCDYALTRESSVENAPENFKLATCVCKTGWGGSDCSQDVDACVSKPCGETRTCTDKTPAEEVASMAFTCGPCPAGYASPEGSYKCTDVNECDGSDACPANSQCENTEGSFLCNCNKGYRKNGDQCTDINECAESTSDCAQVCKNTEGSFTCTCYNGYTTTDAGKTCTPPADKGACDGHTCAQICVDEGGSPTCKCGTGYLLIRNEECKNIDECALGLCPQACKDNPGSFVCSCFDGYSLGDDGVTCEKCAVPKWGPNCANTCNCNGRATRCDSVKGCICEPTWSGSTCEVDVNECEVTPDICGLTQTCENIDGGYKCNCPEGYDKEGSNCIDKDECAAEVFPCDPNADCVNTVGSFSCVCKQGFIPNGKACDDIDECSNGVASCEQTCANTGGSFNCQCRAGYTLNDDRSTCRKYLDVCGGDQSCAHYCVLENEAPTCKCNKGYQLAADKRGCNDIDECASADLNLCTDKDTCKNVAGGFECSCPLGKKLQNDQRTCSPCDDNFWGLNCQNECGCVPKGSDSCNKETGCVCKKGWAGSKCESDINECDTVSCMENAECNNLAGTYECKCRDGFVKSDDGSTCNDVNECTNPLDNECERGCENTVGGYTCTCQEGYVLEGKGKCVDVDECALSKSDCQQKCVNTDGSFVCECYEGFDFDPADRSKCIQTEASKCSRTDCAQKCRKAGGVDTCFCDPGYTLNADGKTCDDINECDKNPPLCSSECANTPAGSYTCSCEPGFSLAADGTTCTACIANKWGDNCVKDCLCKSENTKSCDPVNGECTCRNGWTGTTCETDVKECDTPGKCGNNGVCEEQTGSYKCTCEPGYLRTDVCTQCSPFKYGTDCGQTCACDITNAESCNHVDGVCTCKPEWTGADCKTDVDECAIDGRVTCKANEECNNLVGSFECVCTRGYVKSPTTGECVPCNKGSYGDSCLLSCDCEVGHFDSCNNLDGTCTCYNGWVGSRCETNVDECAQTPPVCPSDLTKCSDTAGSFECQCVTGYQKNADKECVACAFGKYDDCIKECPCTIPNIDSCNNINGSCTCKTGWSGDRCDTDINECDNTPAVCNTTISECRNTNGAFECDCKTGYKKSGKDCVPCDFGKYDDCIKDCPCTISNINSCNNIDGSCSCKSGWSGDRCDTDINECDVNPTSCNTTISDCRNTNGAFECDCKTGYKKSGKDCVPCDFGKYDDCIKDCPCTITNIDSCNNINGSCTCKTGWSGDRCDTDINECDNTPAVCNMTISECRNTNGAFACDCKTGYISADASNCIDTDECSNSDLNSCRFNCINTQGSYYCTCPIGYSGSGNNCTDISLKYRVVFVLNINRRNTIELGASNRQYQDLVTAILNSVIQIIRPILGNAYVPPNLISLESGSIISNIDMKVDPTKTGIADNLASAGAKALATSPPVLIDGTEAPVASVKLNEIPVGVDENPCILLKQLKELASDEYCEVSDGGIPVLRKLDSTETDVPLIIGLTVPFALIFILVVALIVYFCCCRSPNKTYGRRPPSDEGRDNLAFRSAFAGNLPTKGNFGASRYMMYSPHTLSETASQASGEGYKPVRPKTLEGRSDFNDMPAQSERNYQQFSSPRDGWEDNGRSNFSWENMFNVLEPSKNPPFEVPRPNVSNSPARVYRGNGKYDSLA